MTVLSPNQQWLLALLLRNPWTKCFCNPITPIRDLCISDQWFCNTSQAHQIWVWGFEKVMRNFIFTHTNKNRVKIPNRLLYKTAEWLHTHFKSFYISKQSLKKKYPWETAAAINERVCLLMLTIASKVIRFLSLIAFKNVREWEGSTE